jgi:hypothetical protein
MYQRLFLIAVPTMRHSPAKERAIALADATGAALRIMVMTRTPYLMDAFTRLPTQRASEIEQLLPHKLQLV